MFATGRDAAGGDEPGIDASNVASDANITTGNDEILGNVLGVSVGAVGVGEIASDIDVVFGVDDMSDAGRERGRSPDARRRADMGIAISVTDSGGVGTIRQESRERGVSEAGIEAENSRAKIDITQGSRDESEGGRLGVAIDDAVAEGSVGDGSVAEGVDVEVGDGHRIERKATKTTSRAVQEGGARGGVFYRRVGDDAVINPGAVGTAVRRRSIGDGADGTFREDGTANDLEARSLDHEGAADIGKAPVFFVRIAARVGTKFASVSHGDFVAVVDVAIEASVVGGGNDADFGTGGGIGGEI